MTEEQIVALLPKRISIDRYQEALRLCHDGLGGDALIFKRVAHCPDDAPQWWDDAPAPRMWAAQCRCTACGNSFYLGYVHGTAHSERAALRDCLQPGVIIPEGPDGLALAFVPEFESEFTSAYREGETLNCPDCGASVTLRKSSFFRRPRTYRMLFGEVRKIRDFAAVVYWLLSRTISADGDTEETCVPFRAVKASQVAVP